MYELVPFGGDNFFNYLDNFEKDLWGTKLFNNSSIKC